MSSDFAIRASGVVKEFKDLGRPLAQLLNAFNLASARFAPRRRILDGLDFTIAKGEKVGILGMNGAGKSTLLQIMAGNSKPTEGMIAINGKIGAILELGAGFHPDLTGRQNAETLLQLSGMAPSEIPKAMDWIIDFSGLRTSIDLRTRGYSSGMLVRLAFATATSGNPDIFFVDEALAVGDAAFQQKCYAHLQTALSDATLVLISHDLAAVSALCDRAIVLDGGRIVFDGPPQAAFPVYNRLIHGSGGLAGGGNIDESGIIGDACKSGPRELDIVSANFTVNGIRTTVARPGDLVRMTMTVRNLGSATGFITGVSALDIRGQVVFGQNTELIEPFSIREMGNSRVDMEFVWPKIATGAYFLTLGVASTAHGIHKVQCWANHIVQINAVLGQNAHGIFNVDLETAKSEDINA
jgi:ABC-type polysaccharide/polyol phosphate transport system ATPase subunit